MHLTLKDYPGAVRTQYGDDRRQLYIWTLPHEDAGAVILLHTVQTGEVTPGTSYRSRRALDADLPKAAKAYGLAKMPPVPTMPKRGRYRHHKGDRYDVVGVARSSETLEHFVVYREVGGSGNLWVRPHAEFTSEVAPGVLRFVPMSDWLITLTGPSGSRPLHQTEDEASARSQFTLLSAAILPGETITLRKPDGQPSASVTK